MDGFEPDTGTHIYTPSELNREARLHLEAGFPRILLEAEISNLSRPASGHIYFSLKDESAQVRCAMFRSAALRCNLALENGKKVLARGRISLYEARGEYQFIVDGLHDAGMGRLQERFEQLKKKLEAEGLFDPGRKKSLPPYPFRIGIITSATGAAVQDIRQVLGRRWPVADVRLYAVAVQGAEAPAEIRKALLKADREAWAQVIILGRGGGSLEDLQAFNDESVARAVAASGIPVISAVGHETDFSICDFVADVRAPTPSAAAELATPDQVQLRGSLDRFGRLLAQRQQSQLQRRMQQLDYLAHRLTQRDPALRLHEQSVLLSRLGQELRRGAAAGLRERQARLEALSTRLGLQHPLGRLQDGRLRLRNLDRTLQRLVSRDVLRACARLQDLGRTLHAVSPLATMGRGYAVLFDARTGRLVTSVGQVDRGQLLSAQLSDGRLRFAIDEVTTETLEDELKKT